MKKSLGRLPTRAEDGCVNVIVESPRGSRLKFEFDPKAGSFTVGRPLPLGMRLIAAAMAPLALSIALDAFVVSVMVVGNPVVGALVGVSLATMFLGMWFVWPTVAARRPHR